MATGEDSAVMRRRLAEPVSKLVEFLRDLASARFATVSDVDKHIGVYWLADLPPSTDLSVEAGPGDVLLSLDPMASEPPPRLPPELAGWVSPVEAGDSELSAPPLREGGSGAEIEVDAAPAAVGGAYSSWLDGWLLWAEQDRAGARHRHWYDSLVAIHQALDQRSDEIELVLATGLLRWLTAGGRAIRTHLLSTRLAVTVDQRTGRVDVMVDAEAITRIADRDLLEHEPGFNGPQAEPVRQSLRESTPVPLGGDTKELLERWRSLAMARCRPYEHDAWAAPTAVDVVAELSFAPALVHRRRDSASLVGYYDQMLAALSGPDAEAPLGLAQLVVAIESEERVSWLESEGTPGLSVGEDPLFPLPSNDEQRRVIERLRHDNGVVVQGPPGTGKSHSIANLMAALLARGMRVLVTSQKAQALRVLREKLPEDISELCVSMTDLSRGGSAELNRSVTAISGRFANFDSSKHVATTAELSEQRQAALRRTASLREQIRALRESETYQHPEVAPGYSGTLGNVGRRLAEQEAACRWMPFPLPPGAATRPPLTIGETGELRRLLAEATPQRRSRTAQVIPDPSELPAASTVRSWMAAERAAAAAAEDLASDLSRRIGTLPAETVDSVATQLEVAQRALVGLDLGPDPSSWPSSDWRVRCLTEGLAGQDEMVWSQLHELASEALTAAAGLQQVGLRQVVLPAFDPDGPGSLAGQLEAARQLRDWLLGGGELRKRFPKAPQRNAEPLLTGASVDGIHPTNPELLELVLATLESTRVADALADRWAVVGLDIDRALPLVRRVALLTTAVQTLGAIRELVSALRQAVQQLTDSGVAVVLPDVARWSELTRTLDAVRAQQEAEAASAHIAGQVEALGLLWARSAEGVPEVAAASTALATRSAADYEIALANLATASREQSDQVRCDELWVRLHEVHPGLAQLLERTASDPSWDTRLGGLETAWAWAKARTFFDEQRQPGLDQRLDDELADAVSRLEVATTKLAAAEAWSRTLERMDASQAQALRAYRQHMMDRGKGLGRYAHRYARAAREAMVSARDAVPAWIMPLPEVLETIPPDRNSFDVVIVDEASQASLESLFLLWLAPRMIVVGDDRQCTPSQVSHGELQPIFDKLDQYLRDIPDYLRVAFTPRSSLYSLMSTRFGSVIRLREHFRCMPEIIGWSSRQFYADSPLVPLRQFGADRLPPLRRTYVEGAFSEGSSTRLRNPVEAEALVDQLVACIEDPAYVGRTFGVVVLQGTGQIGLIQDLLQERLPVQAWERHRLRVGSLPDFQGDERHVVFVSMVVAETPRAVTMMDWQRRFNVAASRAQDQMWLFHSVTADALSPSDLRRSLLAYVANPPAPETSGDLSRVTDDEPHPAFDSLFEQRVFRQIRDRGYSVTPQFEVNGKRIDLVVTGAKGRLAVECDGEAFHTTAEQREADLHRELGLRRAGWKFWRIRESEFYFDRERALGGLWTLLEARGILPHDLETAEVVSGVEGGEWSPTGLSRVEGADGLEDDPLGAAGLDAVVVSRVPAPEGGPRYVPTGGGGSGVGAPTTAEVREWARSRGEVVGLRGRLHPDIVVAWNEAHPERRYAG